ncbi:MAG TPA: hypothetical protein PLJ38_04365, partial [bacterium]|nr:hypothetical protein [bacterium]
VLVVSSPEYTANTVKIKGFAEDDIELKAIRINGELLNFDARGIFEKILVMDEKLQSALVEAEDGSGKKTTVVVTLQDNLAPVVDVISAVIENGRAILEVRATDNIALQEITINGQPIAMTLPPTGGVFKYTIAINKDMIKVDGGKEIVELKVKALDKAGLLSEKIAKAELPPDVNAPELVWDVRLEGNLVVVKGLATDNKPNDRGIASLKINGEQVRIFDNGAFERTFEVKVKPPVLRIVETVIDRASGKYRIKGMLAEGEIIPTKFEAELADLAKPAHIVKQQKSITTNFTVLANGQRLQLGPDGSFIFEAPVELPVLFDIKYNDFTFFTRYFTVPAAKFRSELKIPADANEGVLTLELQTEDGRLMPLYAAEVFPNGSVIVEGVAYPKSLAPQPEFIAGLAVKYTFRNAFGAVTHQGTIELKRAEDIPISLATAIMSANLRRLETKVKLEQKFAILYKGKLVIESAVKTGKINLAVVEQGASILKPLNNETIEASKENKELALEAAVIESAGMPEILNVNIKYIDANGNIYKTEKVTLARSAEKLPEAVVAAQIKVIDLNTLALPQNTILYAAKSILTDKAVKGKIVVEIAEPGAVVLRPSVGRVFEMVPGGREIILNAGILSGSLPQLPEVLTAVIRYIDEKGATYRTDRVALARQADILSEGVYRQAPRSVECEIIPLPPVAIIYTARNLIDAQAKKGKVTIEITSSLGAIVQPINGAVIEPGKEIIINAGILSDVQNIPDVINISLKYYDVNNVLYKTVPVALTKTSAPVPATILEGARKIVETVIEAGIEPIYKYVGTLNMPADFRNVVLTPDLFKLTVTNEGVGIVNVSWDALRGANEYILKWQFKGSSEMSRIIVPQNNNIGRQIIRLDNLAGDGDEIKFKPIITNGTFNT